MIDLLPATPAWVAVDCETSGLHPDDGARVACVAVTWPIGDREFDTLAFPFDQGIRDKFPTAQLDFDFGGTGSDPNLSGKEWRILLDWLAEQRLVFHNGKFDLAMLRVGTRHWPGRDLVANLHWDTMLAQRVMDPTERAALDLVCQRLGIGAKRGLDSLKAWLKANGYPPNRYDLVPWSIAKDYVTGDTEMTAQLFAYQLERLELGLELNDVAHTRMQIQRELDMTVALYRMEQRGIMYDDGVSLEAAEKLDRMANDIEKTMPFRCTPTEAHAYFFNKLKLPADRVSDKTGRPSLDEEQVRKWVKEEVPWASEYAQVTKYRRAVSMWYRGYPEKIGHDGRLRTSFRQGQALTGKESFVKSGRMSVERVQLQAIPKKDKNIEGIPGVRELILAPEGYGLWNLDLSQAELRVATKYARCERMADMLARGVDAHGETTKTVIGISPDDPLWKEKRDIAKRLNFGGIFQIGGETFQKTLAKLADIHLPLDECYRYVQGWRSMYPEFGVAYRKAERTVQDRGWVRLLPNTRQETRSYFTERDFPNTGWNRIVQGSLAEAFKIWVGQVEQRWPGYMVLIIHDSLVLECPLDEGDQVSAEISAYGVELMSNLFSTEMIVDVDRW